MAVEIVERFDSREFTEGDKPSLVLRYLVYGTDLASEVGQKVEETAPQKVGALYYREYSAKNVGGDVWEVEVQYDGTQRELGEDSLGGYGGAAGDKQANLGDDLGGLGGPAGGGSGQSGPGGAGGDQGQGTNDFGGKWSYSFETGGGTQHITQSKQTVSYGPAGGPEPPDYGGAINVSKDQVNGVDISVPVFRWTETHKFPIYAVTPKYKGDLFTLTGTTNAEAFRGFLAQEVLFEGASGSIKDGENWELTFKFAASPKVLNQAIGNITVNVKNGHDFLWVRYQDVTDENALVRQPVAVYVERVYDYKDFNLLGLGK